MTKVITLTQDDLAQAVLSYLKSFPENSGLCFSYPRFEKRSMPINYQAALQSQSAGLFSQGGEYDTIVTFIEFEDTPKVQD